jgi:Tfp pilus assembly PilM family ATPase
MLAPEMPPLTAGIPEFQAEWAAHLLPEGRQPTACSLQVAQAAAINTFLLSPLFPSLSGTALVLFVFADHTSLAAFHESKLVLYREHPIGYRHLREAISSQMRIEPALTDSVLEDTFIDPTPMIEPVLRTLFRQVEISYDYLTRRRNCQTQNFYVCGLPSGLKYWVAVFSRMLNLTLKPFHPFEGLEKAQRNASVPEDLAAKEPFLMTALGAALAVMEDV